jgi:hypothetical protein
VATADSAATKITDGHEPIILPSGCETANAMAKTPSASNVRTGPTTFHHFHAHHAAPITRTTPPRARFPVIDATANPTINVAAPTNGTIQRDRESVATSYPRVVFGCLGTNGGFVAMPGEHPSLRRQFEQSLAN